MKKDDLRLWLDSYKELRVDELRLWRRHQKLRAQVTRVTTQLRDTPGGGGGDREALLAALADEDAEAMALHNKARTRRREIEKFVDNLSVPIHRAILRLRYVECMNWVAVQMTLQKSGYYYNEKYLFELHGNAMKEAREIWKQRRQIEDG